MQVLPWFVVMLATGAPCALADAGFSPCSFERFHDRVENALDHTAEIASVCTDVDSPQQIPLDGIVECRYEILGIMLDLTHVDPVYVDCTLLGGPRAGVSLTP